MTPLLRISMIIISYLYCVTGQSACTTPDGKSGKCVPIYDCGSLFSLTSYATKAEEKFLQDSLCELDRSTPVVCCDQSSQPTTDAEEANDGSGGRCRLTASPPDPSTGCCGVDASGGGNRIVGGTEAGVAEYPWLVIIEYAVDNKIELLCGGVLLSGQYVMTAAHCVMKLGVPVKVRLGEHDTSNSGPDCVEVEGGGEDCNDGAQIIPIKRTIPHPDYVPSSPLRRHDIALIKLARTVQFTEFIRPICLPSADFTKPPPPANLTLHVAGWGAIGDYKSSSNVKMQVGLPYLSYQDCQPSYSVPGRQVELWEGQICAGGEIGKDSCRGDSGGSLMKTSGTRFELVGIVSFGAKHCGKGNVPGVYTNVYQYLPWIKTQIDA